MKKVYTKQGDQGFTSLHGGERVRKTDLRIRTNGKIDRLNSTLGVVRALMEVENRYFPMKYRDLILNIQKNFMKIMAVIARSSENDAPQVSYNLVEDLEKEIDTIISETIMPEGFIIPGGNTIEAFLHMARTEVREAEISLWELSDIYKVNSTIMVYFNRLSDLLFVMALSLSGDIENMDSKENN